MNGIFRHPILSAVLFSFAFSTCASAGEKISVPELTDPARAEEVRARVAADREAARALLNDVVRSGKDAETRCTAINTLGASADTYIAKSLADVINDADPAVQSCAIRAAGEAKNLFAVKDLLLLIENYLASYSTMGPYEAGMLARIKAIDSVWALGEIGDPAATQKLLKFFGESDNVVKINIAISAGKTNSGYAKKFLSSLAGNTSEASAVRAAAFETLAGSKASAAAPGAALADGIEKGDIIYAGGRMGIPQSWIADVPVGHSGIFGGTELMDGKLVVVIYDCVPDTFQPYGGVRRIYSWKDFTHQNKYPYYGNRVSKVRPTAAQRKKIILAAKAKLGLHYSDTHFQQKGPDLFDCVGYTEYAYEAAGLNPTPDEQETGWGWPLTPAEQFAATVANTQMRPPLAMAGGGSGRAPRTEIIPNTIDTLLKAYGMEGRSGLPEVNSDIRPEPEN